MKKNFVLLCLLSVMLSTTSSAQKVPSPALTADSLATGNYKDILNSFFQLSFNRLIGTDKEIRFTSTPFAVIAKMDTNLLVDTSYLKYTALRNLNFSFGIKLDSSYKFNGFSSALKYALINKRDETVSNAFVQFVTNNNAVQEINQLNTLMFQFLSSIQDTTKQNKATDDLTDFRRGFKRFDQLDKSLQDGILNALQSAPEAQSLYKSLLANKKFNIHTSAAKIYEDLKKEYNNNLLWTIGVADTTYKDHFLFSNIVFSSELLQGVQRTMRKNEVELNIKTDLQLTDDSLKAGRDLKRVVFSFEPGINFVFKTQDTRRSFFEFKLSGSYYHNFSGLYTGEREDILTLNSTLRVRIIDDIWIPLEIKYDPKEGNVFGFLNVKANFTALRGLAKSLKL